MITEKLYSILGLLILATGTACSPGVLFQDDFKDFKGGWPQEFQPDSTVGYHPPDNYHIEIRGTGKSRTVFRGLNFDNASFETEMIVDNTETLNGDFYYGLAIRGSGKQFYAFTISARNQKWRIEKGSPGGRSILKEGSELSINGLKAKDTLRVDARRADLTYSINGHQVAQVNDSEYASGEFGFIAYTLTETRAHVHFDTVVVSKLSLP